MSQPSSIVTCVHAVVWAALRATCVVDNAIADEKRAHQHTDQAHSGNLSGERFL